VTDNATRADVSRLFGRAAFGATLTDLDTWEGKPYETVVDALFPPGPPGTVGRLPLMDDPEEMVQDYGTNDVYQAIRWWLERMRTTPYPLEERMTLFWHDHFATAYLGEPDVGMVALQNRTLRANALGSFRTLANAMTTDAAMLVWLNGIANHTGGVNENYAREFLELFTMGTFPQRYTEHDIREAAKAFTGFLVNTTTRTGQFEPTRHDTTVKTVLGRSIGGHAPGSPEEAAEHREVLEAALAHDGGRSVSRFLAFKLVQQFGYEVTADDALNDPLVQDVAWAIRANDAWDIRKGVRTMLLHPRWRYADPAAGKRVVRSPIETIVHAAKILDFPDVPYNSLLWPQQVQGMIDRTGQVPFLPPNVGGWPHGTGWLSQTTNLGRYDALTILVQYYVNLALEYAKPFPASGDLDWWAAYMGLAGFSTSTKLRLQEYLADPQTLDEVQKQMSMFVLVGVSPDWQVM
jgi:uncharacterized protein (DUF1800 family)